MCTIYIHPYIYTYANVYTFIVCMWAVSTLYVYIHISCLCPKVHTLIVTTASTKTKPWHRTPSHEPN